MTKPTTWYIGNEKDRTIGNWLLVSDVTTDSGADRWRVVNTAMNLPDRCLLKVTEVHSKFYDGDWNQLSSTFRIQELNRLNWDQNKYQWVQLDKAPDSESAVVHLESHAGHGA